ncbi:MAG TPA: peptidyl-prolyl cis-trans isomerase [Planctomycetota bacterium]|nr:peptidyl-prolyl cis-trans isomerase [Planctomycetota bacterium]
MKNLILVAFSFLLVGGAPALAQPRAVERPKGPGGIVAVVGDEVLTQAELDKLVERRMAQYQEMKIPSSTLQREIRRVEWVELERRIENMLLLQLVRKEEKKNERPYVQDADVDAEILDKLKAMKEEGIPVTSVEDLYRHAREHEGLSREEFRRNLKEILSINRYLWHKVFSAKDVFVSPQDSKAYYRSHLKEFTTPVEISFRQILIPFTRDNTVDLLVALVEKSLTEGEDFVAVAHKVQDVLGGDAEEAERVITKSFEEIQHYVKPLPDVLRGLKKGEVSARIRTVHDIRYVKVEDVKDGIPRSYTEAQEEISRKIRDDRRRNALVTFMADVRRKTRVEKYLPDLPDEPE